MERICDKNNCTGCCACMNICPKNCISMQCDEYGVLRPVVNHEECVNCGACQKVCPVNNKLEFRKPQTAYAGWNLDTEIRKTSASGGAAIAFYETMLEQGGVCFGTKFDKDLNLNIQSAEVESDVRAFHGSKYVQACAGYSFKEAKKYLEMDKGVLYIGTPCQIAGLKSYLKKDYEKLITVDLICHGVPSLKYLKTHVNTIEQKIGQQADDITFRGEYSFELALYRAGKLIYRKYRFLDNYFTGFLNGLFYRPNCYTCPYACDKRVSDITIGDFWGLGREKPCAYTLAGGVSVILPNTDKGHAFVMSARDKMFIDERPLSEAINGNAQLKHPSEKNVNYDMFKKLYVEEGFEKAATECTKQDIAEYKRSEVIRKVRGVAGKCKRGVKKLIGK